MRIALFFLCSLLLNPSWARVINFQTDSFADIARKYESLHVPASRTLMVFDLDDTLMTMTQPLGSAGWWDWQQSLLKDPQATKQRFASDLEHLLRVQNTLFERIPMELTDKNALPFLQKAAASGATLMSLTARGADFQDVTFRQLQENGLLNKDRLLFQQYGLQIHHKTSMKAPFACPALRHTPLYRKGVLFLAGGNKGEALRCALAQSDRQYQAILFVDDSKPNNRAMAEAFFRRKDILLLNVHFTREHAKAKDARTNPATQQRMLADWARIQKKTA